MRRSAITVSLLFAASLTWAGPQTNLTGSNATLCDDDNRVCVRGSIVYRHNPRLLELRSRLRKADGPGTLRLRFSGQTREGFPRFTTMEVPVRGRLSEIVNHKLVTDHPDVDGWTLDWIRFSPDDR